MIRKYKHTIEVVVDRVINSEESAGRIAQSVEQALELGDGNITVVDVDAEKDHRFSKRYFNPEFPDFIAPEMEPRTFSFNSPHGACSVCTGLGSRLEVDPELILNPNLTISEGAIRPWNRMRIDAWYMKQVNAMAVEHDFSINVPVNSLSDEQLEKLLYGTGSQKYEVELGSGRSYQTSFEGVIPNLERRHKETESDFVKRDIEKFMVEKPCHSCEGKRLKPEALAVTVQDRSIIDIVELSILDTVAFFDQLQLSGREEKIARQIVKEIKARLGFLVDVGLGYLTLARSANTLSGGEAQRIRLATQIGSGLMGVLYVLDEPSIGLHQRDNSRLIATLQANARSR